MLALVTTISVIVLICLALGRVFEAYEQDRARREGVRERRHQETLEALERLRLATEDASPEAQRRLMAHRASLRSPWPTAAEMEQEDMR